MFVLWPEKAPICSPERTSQMRILCEISGCEDSWLCRFPMPGCGHPVKTGRQVTARLWPFGGLRWSAATRSPVAVS